MKYFLIDLKESTLNVFSQLWIDISNYFEKLINAIWNFFSNVVVFKVLAFSAIAYIEILLIRALFIASYEFPLPNMILGVAISIILPLMSVLILEK